MSCCSGCVLPAGLAGVAGRLSPLRLRVQGGPEQFVFAKLYTKGHVSADRLYKMGGPSCTAPRRTSLRSRRCGVGNGYQDYALRLLQDIGVRTARPYGIAEITPECEYLLVTGKLLN